MSVAQIARVVALVLVLKNVPVRLLQTHVPPVIILVVTIALQIVKRTVLTVVALRVQANVQEDVHRHALVNARAAVLAAVVVVAQDLALRHVLEAVPGNVLQPVQMPAKHRHRNTVQTAQPVARHDVPKSVLTLVRLRHRKDVQIVLPNVVVIAITNVHTAVDASAIHLVVVTAKENAEEVATWNVYRIQKALLVPHAVEHVGVHVTRIVHTIAIQRVRVLATNNG